MIIKKCLECGSVIRELESCNCDNCGIKCCDKEMVELKPNESDGNIEKHKPIYEVNGDIMEIKVDHVMEEEHYIKWISIVNRKKEVTFYFSPEESCFIRHEYIPGSKIYSYCNKHGLWVSEVK